MLAGERPSTPSFAEQKIQTRNLCPFGCGVGDLDQHGYCRHVVGFTNDGKNFEPLKENAWGYAFADGAHPQTVQKGDKVVWITVSGRVYREDAKEKKSA